jgi:hypothetical protein
MDTGPIDSRDNLGINAQDSDRVRIQRNATCVPITTEGHTADGTSYVRKAGAIGDLNTAIDAFFNYTAMFYGPTSFNLSLAGLTDPALQNITYLYTNFRDVATELWRYEESPYDIQ